MSEINMLCNELLKLDGASAAYTTSYLKMLGNGSMNEGLYTIIRICGEDKKAAILNIAWRSGITGFIIGGTVVGLSVLGIHVHNKRKYSAKLQMEHISRIFKEEISDTNENCALDDLEDSL